VDSRRALAAGASSTDVLRVAPAASGASARVLALSLRFDAEPDALEEARSAWCGKARLGVRLTRAPLDGDASSAEDALSARLLFACESPCGLLVKVPAQGASFRLELSHAEAWGGRVAVHARAALARGVAAEIDGAFAALDGATRAVEAAEEAVARAARGWTGWTVADAALLFSGAERAAWAACRASASGYAALSPAPRALRDGACEVRQRLRLVQKPQGDAADKAAHAAQRHADKAADTAEKAARAAAGAQAELDALLATPAAARLAAALAVEEEADARRVARAAAERAAADRAAAAAERAEVEAAEAASAEARDALAAAAAARAAASSNAHVAEVEVVVPRQQLRAAAQGGSRLEVRPSVLFGQGAAGWHDYPPIVVALDRAAASSASASSASQAVLVRVDVGSWGTFQFRYAWARVRIDAEQARGGGGSGGAAAGALDKSGWSEPCLLAHEDPRLSALGATFTEGARALAAALDALRRETRAARVLLGRTPPARELASAELIGGRDALLHERLVDARTALAELRQSYGLGPADARVRDAQLAVLETQAVRYDLTARLPRAQAGGWRFRRAVQDLAEAGDFESWFGGLGGGDGADAARGDLVALEGDGNRLYQLLLSRQVRLGARALDGVLRTCASEAASGRGCFVFTPAQLGQLRELRRGLARDDDRAEARAVAAERLDALAAAAKAAGFVFGARAAVVGAGPLRGRLAKVLGAGGVGWGAGVRDGHVAVYVGTERHVLPAAELSTEPAAVADAVEQERAREALAEDARRQREPLGAHAQGAPKAGARGGYGAKKAKQLSARQAALPSTIEAEEALAAKPEPQPQPRASPTSRVAPQLPPPSLRAAEHAAEDDSVDATRPMQAVPPLDVGASNLEQLPAAGEHAAAVRQLLRFMEGRATEAQCAAALAAGGSLEEAALLLCAPEDAAAESAPAAVAAAADGVAQGVAPGVPGVPGVAGVAHFSYEELRAACGGFGTSRASHRPPRRIASR
jgi:hypothetical protein